MTSLIAVIGAICILLVSWTLAVLFVNFFHRTFLRITLLYFYFNTARILEIHLKEIPGYSPGFYPIVVISALLLMVFYVLVGLKQDLYNNRPSTVKEFLDIENI